MHNNKKQDQTNSQPRPYTEIQSVLEVFTRATIPAALSYMVALFTQPSIGKYLALAMMVGSGISAVFKKDMKSVPSCVGASISANILSSVSTAGMDIMGVFAMAGAVNGKIIDKALMAGLLAINFNYIVGMTTMEIDRLSLLVDCQNGRQIQREDFKCPEIQPPKAPEIKNTPR